MLHLLQRSSAGLVLSAALIVLSGCSGGADGYSNINEKLAPLATAELIPGRGLGPLQPGETTLGEAFRDYGSGAISMIFADDVTAVELSYASQQLHLQFQIPAKQAYALEPPLQQAARDLEGYLEKHPELKDVKVSGLAICMPGPMHKEKAPWWQGSLGAARLGGTLSDLKSSMPSQEHGRQVPMLLPGQKPDLPEEIAGFPGAGVYAHFAGPAASADLFQFTNRVVQEVEENSGTSLDTLKGAVAIGEPRIVRLTLMAPTHY